jgi:hypothetical protein
LRRCFWAKANVRSANVSKMRYFGPSLLASVSATGIAASTRSPEKPAPQPILTTDGTIVFIPIEMIFCLFQLR